MFQSKKLWLILVLCHVYILGSGQKGPLSLVDTLNLRKHLTYMASDRLEGRSLKPESDGLEQAASYIANYCADLELAKFSDNYFQTIASLDSRNVIGIVNGSDKALRNECVLFMAHYDHIGTDDSGNVYNGADDNGSGVVVLMELARLFAELGNKPKRTVVFLWTTAEERGMLGSKYYTENPIYPLEKTKVCINIDMCGRVKEPGDTKWDKSPKKIKDFDGLFTLINDVWPELKSISDSICEVQGIIPDHSLPSRFLRSSDHYHFHLNGVPIINYSTGYHADFHRTSDDIEKINFAKMKRVADLAFITGLEIANQ